jgi:hypothetical protein
MRYRLRRKEPGYHIFQLQSAELSRIYLGAEQYGEGHNLIYPATMHRAKGLELDAVVEVAPRSFFFSAVSR